MADISTAIAGPLLEWFERHGRHNLPWQIDRTAYRVWLSEIMLQQTQVATVIPYYYRFLDSFPTIESLADAESDRVLQHWQGLGYYARARNLHKSAQLIRDQHNGKFPESMDAVMALPGIGRSSAAAILTFAYGHSWPILDGNVKRVLARYFQVPGWYGQGKTMKQLWSLSERVTPQYKTGQFNQAVMDLGSMVCVRTKPLCEQCPLTAGCLSFKHRTQNQYPEKNPKKDKPHKNTLMLLHRYRDQVLLYRRPPTGIWGGLWSLPEVGIADEIDMWQEKNLSLRSPHLSINENMIRHQFTHFSLDISVAVFELKTLPSKIVDSDDCVFVSPAKIPLYGLPTPVRKILTGLCLAEV
ncbi:MAG: A/G-specific adenine glycosylase [Gammaproteobacteria bacterium]|nr:A/G-specific adenine glycosylase [Gammaproteobacteria bacterium]